MLLYYGKKAIYKSYHYFLLLIFFATLFFTINDASNCGDPVTITLQQNEYKGIVIGIDENVEENSYLIDDIKEAFTEASEHLYKATKNRAFFKEITILVPKKWTQEAEYENSEKEVYENSHIRIKDPGADQDFLNYFPFVKRANNECGNPGLYMQLTPEFFMEAVVKEVLGSLGKTIIRDFGQLRWGLYEEYPTSLFDFKRDPLDKTFYWDSTHGKWEATRCALAINVIPDPGCDIDSLDKCDSYSVSNTNQNAEGSIMFSHFYPSMNSFCDDDFSNPLTYHNRAAPNRQNRLCSGKSAWAVMNESPDFGDSNPPRDVEDTTPTFRVVQQKVARRVVLVLDVSGSMEEGVGISSTRLERLDQAASIYLNKVIDDCSYVGIVTFHTEAAIMKNLTSVKNNRKTLINALPTSVLAATCIACGIQKALQVLQEEGSAKGGYMLIISDGDENISPYIANITDEVIAAGVVVDALAFNQIAAPALETISEATGGTLFYTSDKDSSTSLYDNLLKTIECRPFYCENQTQTVTVDNIANIVKEFSNITGYSYIDSSLGKDTEFVFTWEAGDPIEVLLTSPDGHFYDQYDSGYTIDLENSVISVDIAGTAEVGAWEYTITNPNHSPQEVAIILSSAPSTSDDPILLNPFVETSILDFSQGDKQSIFAEVIKGYSPVLNVAVEALLETPTGADTVNLLDNGAGCDLSKDDGIYSSCFTNIVGDGRYGVKISAKNDGKAVIKDYFIKEQTSSSIRDFPKLGEIVTPADSFSRVGSAGAFTVTSYSTLIDPYPPSRIIDLMAAGTDTNRTFTLTWTAVGSDLDTGTASEYDFRTSFYIDDLYERFESAKQINQNDVLSGNLKAPQKAGSTEEITVWLSDVNDTYIAGRAIDENGYAGDVSNVVQLSTFITTDNKLTENTQTIILSISVGVGCGIIAVITISVIIAMYRRNRMPDIPKPVYDPTNLNARVGSSQSANVYTLEGGTGTLTATTTTTSTTAATCAETTCAEDTCAEDTCAEAICAKTTRPSSVDNSRPWSYLNKLPLLEE